MAVLVPFRGTAHRESRGPTLKAFSRNVGASKHNVEFTRMTAKNGSRSPHIRTTFVLVAAAFLFSCAVLCTTGIASATCAHKRALAQAADLRYRDFLSTPDMTQAERDKTKFYYYGEAMEAEDCIGESSSLAHYASMLEAVANFWFGVSFATGSLPRGNFIPDSSVTGINPYLRSDKEQCRVLAKQDMEWTIRAMIGSFIFINDSTSKPDTADVEAFRSFVWNILSPYRAKFLTIKVSPVMSDREFEHFAELEPIGLPTTSITDVCGS
jgi:hypothetical protein